MPRSEYRGYGATIMRSSAHSARAATLHTIKGLHNYSTGTPLWQQFLAFFVGFSIQFNMLMGGSGEGATATGGYGYRLTDIIALSIVCLLGIFSMAPGRILSVGLFGLIVAALFVFPMFSSDQRTNILAQHYVLYSFAALYVAVILNKVSAVDKFCWGLIVGVLATVPILFLQDSGYSSTLAEWGLVPGYSQVYEQARLRYSGLFGHPNEAGHVAALSAAAGAYLFFVRHRFLPLAIGTAGHLAIFYYTWTRGAVIAEGTVLLFALLFARRHLEVWRLAVIVVVLAVVILMTSEIDFVTSRFLNDSSAAGNIGERINSTLYSLQIVLTHPFGVSSAELPLLLSSGTEGTSSTHNGFFFFGGIFGLVPLIILLAAFLANLQFRNETDIFFGLLTVQVCLSFLFEQLPGSYPYIFIMCIIVSRAFLKTRIGALLKGGGWPITSRSGLLSLADSRNRSTRHVKE
jgi:hypothetical protein